MTFNLDRESGQGRQALDLLARLGLGNAWDEFNRSVVEDDSMPGGQLTQADLDALLGGEAAVVVSPALFERMIGALESAAPGDGTPVAGMDSQAAEEAFSQAFADGYGVAAVLQPSDIDGAWDYVGRQMDLAAEDAGGSVQQVDYNGTTILVAPDNGVYGMGEDGGWSGDATPMPSDDEADSGEGADSVGSGEIATARVGDLIVTAGSQDDLEPLIDAATGGDSLLDAPEFQEVRAELPQETLAFFYANAAPITEAVGPEWRDLAAAYFEGDFTETEIDGLMRHLSGLAVTADAPGFRFDTVQMLPGGEPLPAALFPEQPGSPLDFAANVPGSALVYNAGEVSRMQLDQAAYSAAQSIVQAENPQMANEFDSIDDVKRMLTREYAEQQLTEAEKTVGFNLKTDFTDILDGAYGFALGAPNLALGGFDIDAILALGTTDPARMAEQAARLARAVERTGQADIAAGKIGTDTFYTLSGEQMDQAPEVGFGVLGDRFVAGTRSGVDALQNGVSPSLAENPQFIDTMALLPSDAYQVGYIDLGQIVPLVVQLTGAVEADVAAMVDAAEGCADYADQAAAQAAFEQDPMGNSSLDGDFDGQACEDYYGAMGASGATPAPPAGGPENVKALAATAWARDGKAGSSSILVIAEPGS